MSARGDRSAQSAPVSERAARRSRGHAQLASRPASGASRDTPDAGAGRWQVSDIQRSRLLAGAVASMGELGYERTTVGRITARARVSRRTFYEMFAGREECLAALLDHVVNEVQG